jgi:CBS domain-containing protein
MYGGKMRLASDIMTHPAETISKEENLLNAAKKMSSKGIGCLVVINGEGVGVLTERDFLKFVANDRRDVMDVKVGEIMTMPAVTIVPETSIYEASTIMQRGGFRRLPVVDKGDVVGVVTQTDLNTALREDTIRELRAKLDELDSVNKMKVDTEKKIGALKSELDMLQKMRNVDKEE